MSNTFIINRKDISIILYLIYIFIIHAVVFTDVGSDGA